MMITNEDVESKNGLLSRAAVTVAIELSVRLSIARTEGARDRQAFHYSRMLDDIRWFTRER